MHKYHPTPAFEQAYLHKSGNWVMKYSCGQALSYLPFFAIAHTWATLSPAYDADGFSLPYQLMISLGSLLIAFIGLYFLRRVLLEFFSDRVTGITLLGIVLGHKLP